MMTHGCWIHTGHVGGQVAEIAERIGQSAKRFSRPLPSIARPPLREENRVVGAYLGAGLSSNCCFSSSKSSKPTRNTKGPLAPEFSAARIGPFRSRTLGTRSTRRSNAGATCGAYFGGKAGSRISGQSERVRAHVARPSGSRRSSASPGACQAEFPGSRLCSGMEVMETTAIPDLEGNAWVRPSFISTIDRSVLDAAGLVLLGDRRRTATSARDPHPRGQCRQFLLRAGGPL
jgi:hypothetical protein